MSQLAFCCLGTLLDGAPYIWVMEILWREENSTGDIRFWESTTGDVYDLPRRISDRRHLMSMDSRRTVRLKKQKARESESRFWSCCRRRGRESFLVGESVEASLSPELTAPDGTPLVPLPFQLPYRTLDMIFNNNNVWVNKQHFDPSKVWFDFWDTTKWHQVIKQNVLLTPAFTTPAFLPPHTEFTLRQMEQEAYEQVTREISLHRSARNLNTLWNKDTGLQNFLRKGLQLRYRREVCTENDQSFVDAQLLEWKRALMSKIPPSWRLNGTFMRFAAADAVVLGPKILDNCDFVDTRSRLSMFALGVRCNSYPGQITSIFIILVATTKVSDGEKRRLNFDKQKRERLKKQRDKADEETTAPMLDRLESLKRSLSSQGAGQTIRGLSVGNNEPVVDYLGTFDGEGSKEESVDWEAIYRDIRNESPDEYDKLFEYYLEEGFDEESAKYWAAYYLKKLLGEDQDIESGEYDYNDALD
eukprot:Gregarina_sp_Poly_1__7689@NODE_432_length_8476_cov_39_955524_g352_i0_p2_GENE_NODE_432_length_8476_cov_39_955524_g352_i0NODE_432_length_8476_cov_39_955524_g352_i0_p2_ORF_typecomplete_len473_score70_24Flu_PA/PF00603_17/0_12_NODE_432_length_8476_cov_39_955524_g352_i045115929